LTFIVCVIKYIRRYREDFIKLRVISGHAKGRKLKTPSGLNTRPTTDRIKESIFNVINNKIINSNVLDFFAGSGALGIEALSRGANFCVFVDRNYEAIKCIKNNVESAEFIEKSRIIKCDWRDYFKKNYYKEIKYDIILLDPPYGNNMINLILNEINEKDILNNTGIIVVESDIKDNLEEKIYCYSTIFSRRYGRTNVTIYTRSEE
jgi:16S rRNA (guanine(966)-N(2))-methyltransferase RsmD